MNHKESQGINRVEVKRKGSFQKLSKKQKKRIKRQSTIKVLAEQKRKAESHQLIKDLFSFLKI